MFSTILLRVQRNLTRFLLGCLVLLFQGVQAQTRPMGMQPSTFGNSTNSTNSTTTPARKPTTTAAKRFGPGFSSSKKDSVVSVIPDSLKAANQSFQETVFHAAEDSTIMDLPNKKVYLYGNAIVSYGDIELRADYIELDWNKNEVKAHGRPDTTQALPGRVRGKPVFIQSGDEYNSDTISYNFSSKKALIKNIVTQQGEGIIQGKTVKKDSVDNLYLVDAKYSTCNLSEPHFHIAARKIKLVDKKSIISGPFNFVLSDIPTPVYFPFGFFPVPKKKEIGTSGFIMGTYGEEPRNRGFYFRDFGYYHAFNEYIGAKVLGQIYSKGSWGLGVQSTYTKRYRYTGNLNLQFNYNKPGEEFSTRSASRDFNISWTHSPQTRRTDRSFSASVNLVSNGFNQNNRRLDELDFYTNNAFGSSIQFTKNFGKLIRTSSGFRVDQNVSTRVMNGNLSYSVGLNQFNPFVSEKKQVGRWYETFRMGLDISGGLQVSNDITRLSRSTTFTDYKVIGVENKPFSQQELRDQALGRNRSARVIQIQSLEDLREVINRGQFRTTYTVPITLPNFKIAKYLNFTPGVSYRGEIFTQKLNYTFIPDSNAVRIDTSRGVFNAYNWSMNAAVNTRIYGTFQFGKKSRIQAIRHTMAPSVSMSFAPDLKDRFFQRTIVRNDEPTNFRYLAYFPELAASAGATGSVGFSLVNQLEAKIRAKSDTAQQQFQKISLLDNLSLAANYNLLADSMNLSTFNLSTNTSLFKNLINLNVNAILDPYFYAVDRNLVNAQGDLLNPAGRRTRFYKWQQGDGLVDLSFFNVAISTRISPKTFRPEAPKKTENQDPAREAMEKFLRANPMAYVDFSIPWSLNLSYNLNYSRQGLADAQIVQAVQMQGDFSLTPKWKINLSTGWDFQFKAPTLTTIGIMRELHCWDMAFNWTPIAGNNQRASNFSFDLRVRSSLLRDLKISRRRVYFDQGGF